MPANAGIQAFPALRQDVDGRSTGRPLKKLSAVISGPRLRRAPGMTARLFQQPARELHPAGTLSGAVISVLDTARQAFDNADLIDSSGRFRIFLRSKDATHLTRGHKSRHANRSRHEHAQAYPHSGRAFADSGHRRRRRCTHGREPQSRSQHGDIDRSHGADGAPRAASLAPSDRRSVLIHPDCRPPAVDNREHFEGL
jgi:hypothetical protein